MRLRDITEARIVPGVGRRRSYHPNPSTGFMRRAVRDYAPFDIHTKEGIITVTAAMLWSYAIEALVNRFNVSEAMATDILNSDVGDTIMLVSAGRHTADYQDENGNEYETNHSREATEYGVSVARASIRDFIENRRKKELTESERGLSW